MASGLLYDRHGNKSSKRVFGAVGLVFYYILVGLISAFSVYTGNDIGVNVTGLVNGLGLISGGLLGVGVAEGISDAIRNRSNLNTDINQ